MPRPKKPPPEVVRRSPGEPRKQLPEAFEALARGEKPVRKPPPRRLDDPRDDFLVRGVANRDARAVFDRRLTVLKALIAARDEAALGDALCDAVLMSLWRGRRLTSLDALAVEILGIDAAHAHELAKASADRRGLRCEPQREELVAVWMRFEAALAEANLEGTGSMRASPNGPRLVLELAPVEAADAIVAAARKIAPLAGAPSPRRPAPQRRENTEDRGPGSQRFRRRS